MAAWVLPSKTLCYTARISQSHCNDGKGGNLTFRLDSFTENLHNSVLVTVSKIHLPADLDNPNIKTLTTGFEGKSFPSLKDQQPPLVRRHISVPHIQRYARRHSSVLYIQRYARRHISVLYIQRYARRHISVSYSVSYSATFSTFRYVTARIRLD